MRDAKALGFALGALLAGISIVCGILVYAAPNVAITVAGYLTHSTIPFVIKPFDAAGFIIGLVLWFVIGFVIGFVFAKLCGCCEEKPKKQ